MTAGSSYAQVAIAPLEQVIRLIDKRLRSRSTAGEDASRVAASVREMKMQLKRARAAQN